MEQSVIFGLILSILLGAVIGAEREMPRDGVRPGNAQGFGGIRSYALIATLGAMTVWLDAQYQSNLWVILGTCISAIIVTVSYVYAAFKKGQMGVTSEYAAILTFFIGVMCMKGEYIFAVILTIFLMIILSSKHYLRSMLGRISREELGTTLKFAVIALVILPLLPDVRYSFLEICNWILQSESGLGWEHKILTMKFFNPHSVWFFVVIMSGVEFIAYILSRTMGARGGILASGAVGGLISSTATTAAMTEKSHRKDGHTDVYVVGTLVASCIMFVRVVLISAFYSPSILTTLLIPASVMFVVLVGATLYFYYHSHIAGTKSGSVETYESPFRVGPALKFAGLIVAIKFFAGIGLIYKDILPEKIFYYGLGLMSGLADVDAITQDMASKSAEGSLTFILASSTILIAVMSNNMVKASIAYRFGETVFGKKVFYSFLASILAGIIVIIGMNLTLVVSAAFI